MNPYYVIGFLIGISIGLMLVWKYLPYVNYINKSNKNRKKQKELEKSNSNSNSTFDLD